MNPEPVQLTVDGGEVPHPPPDTEIGGFRLPLPEGGPMAENEEQGTKVETEREMVETTESITETPADPPSDDSDDDDGA